MKKVEKVEKDEATIKPREQGGRTDENKSNDDESFKLCFEKDKCR
jgi:hypothetical protein